MKIDVDRTKCVGLGLCEAADPEHFEVNDDGKLVLVRDSFTEDERRAVEDAVRACPTAALRIVGALS
ncbi:ferredoxin [Microbacterium sp. SLBN-111]|uniref:ferredoxin n=1 Tax=Microbacterium sp. SLBN-111 TaxID=3377733 RepID=UPI003C78BE28